MEAPTEYKTAGTILLVGGILNILTAGVWILSFIWVCIGIMWIVPLAIGAWQAFVGYKAMNGEVQPSAKMAGIAGIVAGVFNLNPLAIAAGVVGMLNVDKPEAKAFLESGA